MAEGFIKSELDGIRIKKLFKQKIAHISDTLMLITILVHLAVPSSGSTVYHREDS